MLVTNDRVVVQEDGGELYLLHLDTGRYFTLNRTGLLVWQALETGRDPYAAVSERYPSVPDEQVRADVAGLLEALTAAELLHDEPS